MNEEIILDKLRKMLFTTQQANECGLSNNDFKEDIHALSGAIGLIENLIKENKELKEGLKYRVNHCKLLERDLYGTKENEFEKTEYEKRYLED